MAVILIVCLFAATQLLNAAFQLALTTDVSPPAPVGAEIKITALAEGAAQQGIWYRFRVRNPGAQLEMIRDYSPIAELNWSAPEYEGSYELEVSARDQSTGEVVTRSLIYQITPQANAAPVVNETRHPLVFLYSAPACPNDSVMRVRIESPEGIVQHTPDKPCVPGRTMNFYLAGLVGDTEYRARHIVSSATAGSESADVMFRTGAAPDFMKRTVLQEPQDQQGIIFESPLAAPMMATDLWGRLVWFYPHDITFATRPETGGRFLGILQTYEGQETQVIREFDLVGITRKETNAARLNEQLVAMGKRPISGFHHEAMRLPDGRYLALAGVEQILTGVQGEGAVNVLGDAIIVMDENLQVLWAWDSFDHLDVHREALLSERCGNGACPHLYLEEDANDWLHSNSVQLTPDGNLLLSVRHQDWLIKIDYQNGKGSGNVLWRLGKDGDFAYHSTDPYPWFSHQHDARYIADDMIIVFDNGNTRRTHDPTANSRGQVIRLNEAERTATLEFNVDLGGYSAALGSAQKLTNDNYYFEMGWLPDGGEGSSISVEIDPSGNSVYSLKANLPRYRTFRMQDMYTPY